LRISVHDTGVGIAPDFLPYLFERFMQADGSTTRQHGGLGLGLSIVRNLIEMHGGTVRAESAGSDKGATFTIELPVGSEADDSVKSRRPLTSGRKLKGIKVLVVDDDADTREVVRRFLLQCEATPILAASAEEAQSVLDSVTPDVIVSDIGMPTQDGYEFMRAVRFQGLKTPAVALTAFARPEDRMRSIQAGYQMHLTKPIEATELIAVIASLAGRYESLEST
jgi:CheY-like chemotaxis protein